MGTPSLVSLSSCAEGESSFCDGVSGRPVRTGLVLDVIVGVCICVISNKPPVQTH